MDGENKQMTEAEILAQLPDNIQTQRFVSSPVELYSSAWTGVDDESTARKVWRKLKQNPFIPIGLAGTVYFLSRGIFNMGNPQLSQKMMRGRIMAQGFTVFAIVIGVGLEGFRADREQKLKESANK